MIRSETAHSSMITSGRSADLVGFIPEVSSSAGFGNAFRATRNGSRNSVRIRPILGVGPRFPPEGSRAHGPVSKVQIRHPYLANLTAV